MAGYTDYLNLYFKNPRTDGADTFNVQTMMNDNWDKIDTFASKAGLPDAGKGLVYIKCTDSSGNPLSGCAVQIDGAASVSSADGYVRFSLPSGTYSALVYGPIDYGMEEKVLSVTAYDGKTSEFSVVINDISNGAKKIIITESCVCAFSKRVVSADVFGVGAGGSGGAACISGYNAAAGGAGGKTSTKKSINVGLLFSVSIGAGGSPVNAHSNVLPVVREMNGNPGGDTVVDAGGENVLTANGGEGGKAKAEKSNSAFRAVSGASGGSGSGGAYCSSSVSVGSSGSNGESGGSASGYEGGSGQGVTTCSFGEANSYENYSSAGGSAAANSSETIVGSSGSGAGTGDAKIGSAAAASSATTPGSGGGAAAAYNGGTATSGAGADGLVIFRWEVAS